jgi:hypothetical protein
LPLLLVMTLLVKTAFDNVNSVHDGLELYLYFQFNFDDVKCCKNITLNPYKKGFNLGLALEKSEHTNIKNDC